MSRYSSLIAKSEKNKLINPHIIKGNEIKYFGTNKVVTIESINHSTKQVFYSYNQNNNEKFRWWDYFMDANCFVIEKI